MIRLRQYPRRVFFRRASVSSKSPLKCKVIAHRGASGRLPDHTLAGYEAAFNTGCDFIEIDAHATADGELVANHDIELSETTDVSEWAWARDRNTRVVAKCYDGEEDQMEGWMIPDFTLEELKRLRVKMRSSGRDQQYNLKFSIPTIAETCELVQKLVDDIKRASDAKGKTLLAGLGQSHLHRQRCQDKPWVAIQGKWREKGSPCHLQRDSQTS